MPRIERKSGFTMLELLMVVGIISIGAAVTGFSIRGIMPDLQLSATVRDLKSDLNMARLRAVRENRDVSIVFDVDHDAYTIFVDEDSDYDLEEDDGDRLIKSVDVRGKVYMDEVKFGSGTNMQINGRGLPSSPLGHVYFTNSKGSYRGISFNATGKVTIKQSDDGEDWIEIN